VAKKKTLLLDSMEQLKALADPLRQQLLEQFAKQPATTKQVATTLGYQPTRLYHHVGKLEAAGLIRLVEKRPVRGATEKYYETTASVIKVDRRAFDGPSGQLVGDAVSLNVVDGLWSNIRDDIAAFLSNSHEDPGDESDAEGEIVFANAEIEVDEETAKMLRDKMLQELQNIDKSAESVTKGSKPTRKYRIVMGWYPKAPD